MRSRLPAAHPDGAAGARIDLVECALRVLGGDRRGQEPFERATEPLSGRRERLLCLRRPARHQQRERGGDRTRSRSTAPRRSRAVRSRSALVAARSVRGIGIIIGKVRDLLERVDIDRRGSAHRGVAQLVEAQLLRAEASTTRASSPAHWHHSMSSEVSRMAVPRGAASSSTAPEGQPPRQRRRGQLLRKPAGQPVEPLAVAPTRRRRGTRPVGSARRRDPRAKRTVRRDERHRSSGASTASLSVVSAGDNRSGWSSRSWSVSCCSTVSLCASMACRSSSNDLERSDRTVVRSTSNGRAP